MSLLLLLLKPTRSFEISCFFFSSLNLCLSTVVLYFLLSAAAAAAAETAVGSCVYKREVVRLRAQLFRLMKAVLSSINIL